MKLSSTLSAIAVAAILTTSSCGFFGKEKEVATDVCACTQSLEKKLSPEFVKIMTEAANTPDPEKTIEEKMSALDTDQMMAIVPDLEVISEMESEQGEFMTCINSLEKKYDNAYTFDEEKSMKEVLVEMQKMDCAFGVALLKMGMKGE